MGVDYHIERLFEQEFFTVMFGIVLFFSIQWMLDSDHRKEDRPTFRAWLRQQSQEMWVVFLMGFVLISLDDWVVEVINSEYNRSFTVGTWVYLLSGPATLCAVKVVKKLKS